jgi:hypothetical protein
MQTASSNSCQNSEGFLLVPAKKAKRVKKEPDVPLDTLPHKKRKAKLYEVQPQTNTFVLLHLHCTDIGKRRHCKRKDYGLIRGGQLWAMVKKMTKIISTLKQRNRSENTRDSTMNNNSRKNPLKNNESDTKNNNNNNHHNNNNDNDSKKIRKVPRLKRICRVT